MDCRPVDLVARVFRKREREKIERRMHVHRQPLVASQLIRDYHVLEERTKREEGENEERERKFE